MPTLLAIIPHPDDESYSFGGTIALAARAGWRCLVECATSGEGGKRHDGGPPGRKAVGGTREAELAASCAVLGAEQPSFWRLPDGGLREAMPQGPRVAGLCRELLPGLVLTLGGDGAYGHPDHIALHRWVEAGWRSLPVPRPALLQAAFPAGLFLPQYEKCIGMMGDPPVPPPAAIGTAKWDHQVDIRAVSATKLDAIRVHRSQLPNGDPETLFPPGIVPALLDAERFADAAPGQTAAAAVLLASFARSFAPGE